MVCSGNQLLIRNNVLHVFSGIKPFVELSIVRLLMKNSQIEQFKYFKVLVQEFHIKVDLGFVNAIVELFAQSNQSDEEEVCY